MSWHLSNGQVAFFEICLNYVLQQDNLFCKLNKGIIRIELLFLHP
jgi:hypothetical protein